MVVSPFLGLQQPHGFSVLEDIFPVSFLIRFLEDWNKDFVHHQFALAKLNTGNDTTSAYTKYITYPCNCGHTLTASKNNLKLRGTVWNRDN